MKTIIRAFVFGAVLMAGLGAFARDSARRPNILYIFTDDQSHRTVGCYPEAPDWVQTPNIDALAESGVRFSHAYPGVWCMPSRATQLTGHQTYGIESLKVDLLRYPRSEYDPKKLPFWPKSFRENGYYTAHIGKWHSGVDTGFGRDWDFQIVWNRPKHTLNAGHYYGDQIITFNGGKDEKVSGYSTDNYTDWAVDFIEGTSRKEKEKPWLLWLCYGATHGPFTPAERHRDRYEGVKVPIPEDVFPPRMGVPDYVQHMQKWKPGPDGVPVMEKFHTPTASTEGIYGSTIHDWARQYNQCALPIDEAVARLVKTLEETGQRDNTMIIFTSDQGYAFGQKGFSTKMAPYDANIRAPLIFNWPGQFPEGKVIRHPVCGVDIPPTIFSVAGIGLPWEMHGHDLTPLLKNPETAEWDHPAFLAMTGSKFGSHTAGMANLHHGETQGVPWWISYSKGRMKYIRILEKDEMEELYDLDADPNELNNLALDPEYALELAALRKAAVAELIRTNCPFVDHLHKPSTQQ